MPKAIPDRWEDYEPIGEQIEGTRFIAFKVPLRKSIACRVENAKRLDDSILLEKIPSLGLIIDLTNTFRYYDPKIFRRNGVNHKKIMIPGHETPTRELANRFICVVKDYLEKNKDNDKLIGVHCTHGVNRTGYLICNYMITQMTVAPQDAIERFANARGYKIERMNYIQALQKLPETNQQNETKSQQLKVQPANWRGRQNVQPENWRGRNERSNLAGTVGFFRRSRSRSPSSFNSEGIYGRTANNSYRQSSDRTKEEINNYNNAAGRYADHHCTMSTRRLPGLSLDYYNSKRTYDPKRYSYKRPTS